MTSDDEWNDRDWDWQSGSMTRLAASGFGRITELAGSIFTRGHMVLVRQAEEQAELGLCHWSFVLCPWPFAMLASLSLLWWLESLLRRR